MLGSRAGGKGTAESDLDIGSVSEKVIAGPKLILQAKLSLKRKRDSIKKGRVGVSEQNDLGFRAEEYYRIVEEKKVWQPASVIGCKKSVDSRQCCQKRLVYFLAYGPALAWYYPTIKFNANC
ncbi:MAG: hypothetical protein GY820_42230 [Gammaproteobacteria bacterium]|nr:hypothetical protein [Gammaproteobacteria bacterium]